MKLRKASKAKESSGKVFNKSKKILKKKSVYKQKKATLFKRTKTIAASIKESEQYLEKQNQIEKD